MVNQIIQQPNQENMVQISKLSAKFSEYIYNYDLKNLCLYVYNYMKDNNLNPISYDIQCKYNYYEIYIEFNNIDECWKCYRFINEKTSMRCILREYYTYGLYDTYSTSSLYRRLPYCSRCIKRKATHCNMLYCKTCARDQESFSNAFYEITTELFSDIIIKYLKIADVCSLQQTCKEMNTYLNDNNIWEPHIFIGNVINWFPLIADKNILYKTFFMSSKSNYMKRMKTKSVVIIQKYIRRFSAKRKTGLLIRDNMSVLMNYYHGNDYTRSPASTLTIGTDLLTKNIHLIFIEKLKLRNKYQDALNQIEEPTFD
jgi:hypothetical protein